MSDLTKILLMSPLTAVFLLLFLLVHTFSSGWHRLAKAYRTRNQFHGEKWSGQSGTFGLFSHYYGLLVVGANHKGLYLAVSLLLRPFHPPLFIPWSHISAKRSRGLFFERCELRFREAGSLTLSISRTLASGIAEAAGRNLTGVRRKPRNRNERGSNN
jgi:hypothetical protein